MLHPFDPGYMASPATAAPASPARPTTITDRTLARLARQVCAPQGMTAAERLAVLDDMARVALAASVRALPTSSAYDRLQHAHAAIHRAIGAAYGQLERLDIDSALVKVSPDVLPTRAA